MRTQHTRAIQLNTALRPYVEKYFGDIASQNEIEILEHRYIHSQPLQIIDRDFSMIIQDNIPRFAAHGLAICANRSQVKMADADRAVLNLVETQVFGAGVIRRVMQTVAARLASTGTKAMTERVGLEAAAKKLERQQEHFVA